MKKTVSFLFSKMMCLILTLSLLFAVMPFSVSAEDLSDGITSGEDGYTVYKTENDVRSAIASKYSDYSSVTVSADFNSHDWIVSNNHRQSTLNTFYNMYYNTHYDTGISNSCTEVSIAILTECMMNNGKLNYIDGIDIDIIFKRVVDAAIDAGWDGDGTPRDMADEIMNGSFSWYSPSYSADYSVYWMELKLKNSFEDGIPVQMSIDGHAVNAVGFLPVTVSYKTQNWLGNTVTKTAEELYVVINDGWYNSAEYPDKTYSYVHFDDVVAITVPEQ